MWTGRENIVDHHGSMDSSSLIVFLYDGGFIKPTREYLTPFLKNETGCKGNCPRRGLE